jgi:hypothetical protein
VQKVPSPNFFSICHCLSTSVPGFNWTRAPEKQQNLLTFLLTRFWKQQIALICIKLLTFLLTEFCQQRSQQPSASKSADKIFVSRLADMIF